MIKKITSRKFIMSLVADVIGIVTLVANKDGNDLQLIASILLIISSTIVYIIGEAKVDAAHSATNIASAIGISVEQIEELIKKMQTNDDPLISSKEEDVKEETKTE